MQDKQGPGVRDAADPDPGADLKVQVNAGAEISRRTAAAGPAGKTILCLYQSSWFMTSAAVMDFRAGILSSLSSALIPPLTGLTASRGTAAHSLLFVTAHGRGAAAEAERQARWRRYDTSTSPFLDMKSPLTTWYSFCCSTACFQP